MRSTEDKVNSQDLRRKPDRLDLLAKLVSSGMSLNEMRRSHGFDYRTVKHHYPNYKPFDVGGAGDAAVIRRVNQQLDEFLRRGRIGKHRENGLRPRD